MRSRTIVGMSAYASVVTSPATCTWPVVIRVSTATRLVGSCASSASRIESLIWSAILSGCPSVTDSDVNRRRDTKTPGKDGRIGSAQSIGRPGSGQSGGYRVPQRGGEHRLRADLDGDLAAVRAEDDAGVVR